MAAKLAGAAGVTPPGRANERRRQHAGRMQAAGSTLAGCTLGRRQGADMAQAAHPSCLGAAGKAPNPAAQHAGVRQRGGVLVSMRDE